MKIEEIVNYYFPALLSLGGVPLPPGTFKCSTYNIFYITGCWDHGFAAKEIVKEEQDFRGLMAHFLKM